MMGKDYTDWTQSVCKKEAVICGKNYRFSVLTSRMIRMEYDAEGIFEDRATQAVLNRNFDVPEYRKKENDSMLEIITDVLHLVYVKEKPFASETLSVQLIGEYGKLTHIHRNIWRFGEEIYDLGGTVRSLDSDYRCTCINTEGEDYYEEGTALGTKVQLGRGLVSRFGCSVLEDKDSVVLLPDGFVEERRTGIEDSYFLGYGHDYYGCLKDFYHLCGAQPLLPRFALGNWWSRYYEYTQEEYQKLIQNFEDHQLPFCVAMVDMDWHKKDEHYGRGWTGYSWNHDYFPEPEKFFRWMHKHGLRVSLLDHPADGVRGHEENYRDMADAMGKDYGADDTIPFDFADPNYIENYFRFMSKPLEKIGMDFWWIDWTQGSCTQIKGLDPLWALNHYHTVYCRQKGERPLILSRFAGPGGHRYPVSFSGDTIVSWKSLAYQPYFTATSANAGYSWWSHDIGGHADGTKDDELETRWVQFGVFSPIFRLHNTKNPFNGKEPWRYSPLAERAMTAYLQLRHRMIPYLYSMNYLCHTAGMPVITPMYYRYPECEEAYSVPGEYFFGTQLLVCPITKPMKDRLRKGKVTAWLPEGIWFDFFDGIRYEGNRWMDLYRGIENIPVLAKAGGIIPLAEVDGISNSTENPECLKLKVYAGADGEFHLYEDDGVSAGTEGSFSDIKIEFNWKEGFLKIHPAVGNTDSVPQERAYVVEFIGLKEPSGVFLEGAKGMQSDYDTFQHRFTCRIPRTSIGSEVMILLGKNLELADNLIEERLFAVLDTMQIEFNLKNRIYQTVQKYAEPRDSISELQTMIKDQELLGIVTEIIAASR